MDSPLPCSIFCRKDELRGSDIPADVQAILFKMPTAGKAVLREISDYVGSAAPSIGGQATIAAGGKGLRFLQNRKTPRTPVLLKSVRHAAGEVVVRPIPPADGSYRFRAASVTVFGLIP